MVDLKERIKQILEAETATGHFWELIEYEHSVELIEQIIKNYEVTNDLHQDFSKLPKQGELIFVAAPTGAGKDNLVIKLNKQNPDKKYIELNMDIFRHYFPEFVQDTSKLTDKNFANETNEFSYEIYMTVQDILLEQFPGTNIIITGTLRDTGWVERTFRKYKANPLTNYRIKMASLVVPKKQSAISVLRRYISTINLQRNSKIFLPGTCRYTSLTYHDETYERFPVNLEYFQGMFGELIDSMEVYVRSSNMFDYFEDTLRYSSDKEEYNGTNALEVVNELRKEEYQISSSEAIELLKMINQNTDYLKSQGTLMDIVMDASKLFGYEHVIERLNGLIDTKDSNIDEPNILM